MGKIILGNGKCVTVNKNFITDIYCHTVICFDDNFDDNVFLNEQLQNGNISKIIVVGRKPKCKFNKNVVFTRKLTKKLLSDSEQIFFMVNVDTDEYVISNIISLKDICDELAIPMGIRIKMSIVLGNVIKNDSDMVTTLKAVFTTNSLRTRYEIVYDYICDNLDELFQKNNYCQFENNRCIANRHDKNKSKKNGCCDSFKYWSAFIYDVAPCVHQVNGHCNVKCLGCKLFTCDYLQARGIRFKLDYMIIAKGFFTPRQREMLRLTWFISKEEILDKLMKTF